MKVKPLECHLCGNHVAWYNPEDKTPRIYCNFCFRDQKMEIALGSE